MAAAQQGSGQSDNSLGFFWVIVAILIALLLIWYNWSAYIVAFLFKIKLLEIACLKPFTSHADDIGHWIAQASPDNVTFKQVQSVSDWIGQMIRYPITVLLFGLAWVMYVGAVTLRFRKTLTMERLLHSEKQLWPHMSAITHVNLVSENINEGNWAMAATPLQFADKHRMIKLERQTSTGPLLDKNVAAKIILDRALSNRVFALQLGRSWSGIDQLPEHTRALFAVFASFANYDGETARRLLASIAGSSKNGSVDFSSVDGVLKKYQNSKIVKEVIARHGYDLTVMATMLEVARANGVVATAEFVWLKPIDRPLWYMLNAVGRHTVFSEIAGPYAHWLAEKASGRPLYVPRVDEATNGLESALNDILYKPTGQEGTEVLTVS